MRPTRLLVSVRDASEVPAAWQGGAAIVDVKDPSRGSLGAPTPALAAEVVARIKQLCMAATGHDGAPAANIAREQLRRDARSTSIAMGELREWMADAPLSRWVTHAAAEGQIQFAKIGLSHVTSIPDWRRLWNAWSDSVAPPCCPVAVAYADWTAAHAPDPWTVLANCTDRMSGVLLDTYTKDGRNLFAHFGEQQLGPWINAVHESGRWIALAGSLTEELLPRALALRPAYLAVRGGVCQGGRDGTVCQELVSQWAKQLTQFCADPLLDKCSPTIEMTT